MGELERIVRTARYVGAWTLGCVCVVAGCSSHSSSPEPGTTSPHPAPVSSSTTSADDQARAAAVVAYEAYWNVRNAANRDPGSKDWTADISAVTADPARQAALDAIKNYASIPARFVGEPRRAPTVATYSAQQPPRAVISDCLDVSEVKIVNAATGADVRDGRNQPPRYRLEAEVVLYPAGETGKSTWLVQKVTPHLEQPC